MMSAFSNIETVHIAAYALLLETIMPDTEFSAFLKYKEMSDKHYYMQQLHKLDSTNEIKKTVAMFMILLKAQLNSFAMLLNFPRHNKNAVWDKLLPGQSEMNHCIVRV